MEETKEIICIDDEKWEIVDIISRKKNAVKRLVINDEMIDSKETIYFTCEKCNKLRATWAYNFVKVDGRKICRNCQSIITRKDAGWTMPEEAGRAISAAKKGVQRNLDYFDFTCPVCNKTYQYRNILRNRKKKYCSVECQNTIWVRAPRYNGTMNKLETRFSEILNEMKINYFSQYQIGLYFADFYLPDYNLIILVDGDYWHVNEHVHPEGVTSEAQKINLANDKRFEGYIKHQTNYRLFRIWEETINSKTKEELKSIIDIAL